MRHLKTVNKEDRTSVISDKLVFCTREMFENNGIDSITDDTAVTYEKRLCPDTNTIKEFWKVKNGYSNNIDRVSFNIQASICQNTTSECGYADGDPPCSCGMQTDIDYLL